MVIRNRLIIALILIAVAVSSLPVSYAETSAAEDAVSYELQRIRDSWQTLPDGELNEYISNNNDTDLYDFINDLSDQEREVLLSKDTMLNNEISIDNEDGTFDKMPYYDWIMKNGEKQGAAMFATRNVVSTFTAKSGYCFYRFVDEHSGYIVRYKVTFTLNSTTNAESSTNNYTVASVISSTGGKNSNNTSLDEVTFAKQMTYMQRAKTSHKQLGDGTSMKNSEGETVYRTAITPIFVLTVKVKKPAYTYGEWKNNAIKIDDSTEEFLTKGSRFNFHEYTWYNSGATTFDQKVYHSEVTDTLTSCVNILSCGFTVTNTASAGLAEGVPDHDVISVFYRHPKLNIDYYVNGGEVQATSSNTEGKNPVSRSVTYNFACNTSYGLLQPVGLGFTKKGYSPKPGAEWENYNETMTWDERNVNYKATDIKDFTDGTYFTSDLRALYVNWEPNVYKITLDNQGADYSGSKAAWYKYNTSKTVTLQNGTSQINYYYNTEDLKNGLELGYRIVKPTKRGYIFKGYFTEKDGKGKQYVNINGSFINQPYKTIGPHTFYAYWEKDENAKGKLTIKRELVESDYHSSHGKATFLFKITETDDPANVYYRKITFDDGDIGSGENGTISRETECILPYGEYAVEALGVYRYESKLKSILPGTAVNDLKGKFQINIDSEEVTAVYNGSKVNWSKFSHNDTVINSLY